MLSLSSLGLHRRCSVSALILKQKEKRCSGLLIPQAQASNGYDGTQQFAGIYYGSNPPQNPQQPISAQPEPSQQQFQTQQQYGTPGAPTASYSRTAYQQLYPQPQHGIGYGLQSAAGTGSASGELPRINPGRAHLNSVRLIGTVAEPQRQGRCALAIIQVPFATKEGIQEFLLEAWDLEANHLLGLHGLQVLIDGRLARDAVNGGVKVVASRIQLVDNTLPSTSYRGSATGVGPAGSGRTTRPALQPEQVWRVHYSTSERTFQELANHFGVKPDTVARTLLAYVFQSKSPLHWRALAEEAGLGPQDDLQLSDFMDVVARYREEIQAMYKEAKPGASPPPLPATNDGMLKVKPIREWALGQNEMDTSYYTVTKYEAKHGLSKLYEALRMAVVADATQGAWNYAAEFNAA